MLSTVTNKSSGFLSSEINMGHGDYVELDAPSSPGIEYYIVDGTEEAPILPISSERVSGEKLFPGLPTRFDIDKNKPVKIYENGKDTSLGYNDISSIDFGKEKEYTIDYTPASLLKAHRHALTGESIRVKIIARSNVTIDSVTIIKHGGDTVWTM